MARARTSGPVPSLLRGGARGPVSGDWPRARTADYTAAMSSEAVLSATRAPGDLAPGDVHVWTLPWHAERGAREGEVLAVLANYVGASAETLAIAREPRGRPVLVGAADAPCFGLTHCDQLMLLAVATQACGIDVEHVHRRRRYREIAAQYFAASEVAWIEAAGEAGIAARFHRLWVAKEALLKANGLGIGEGLRATRLEARDDELRVVAGPAAFGAIEAWHARWFTPAPDYLAAVAIAHPRARVVRIVDA